MKDSSKTMTSSIPNAEEKEKLYNEAIKKIKEQMATLEGGIIIPRMSTVSAVLKKIMPHYLWCGFYFAEEKELVVGPYQGEVACPNIAYTGVCGTAAKKGETLIVPNVHDFPGHIVCDASAQSEIVVPIKDSKGHLIAVFDVDSAEQNAFDETDKKFLEQLAPILLEGDD